MIASIQARRKRRNQRQLRIPIDALVHDPTTDRYLVYTMEERDRKTVVKAIPIRPGRWREIKCRFSTACVRVSASLRPANCEPAVSAGRRRQGNSMSAARFFVENRHVACSSGWRHRPGHLGA
jgi:hypothetical protein